MNAKIVAHRIISSLNSQNPLAECRSCDLAFQVQQAGLFYVSEPALENRKHIARWREEIETGHVELRARRKRIVNGSQIGAKAVNLGFVLETLAPSLSSFPFDPRDCRAFGGEPIDFMIFENLSSRGQVDRLIFGDIKTGGARLNGRQKSIRDAVERKRIVWSTFNAK